MYSWSYSSSILQFQINIGNSKQQIAGCSHRPEVGFALPSLVPHSSPVSSHSHLHSAGSCYLEGNSHYYVFSESCLSQGRGDNKEEIMCLWEVMWLLINQAIKGEVHASTWEFRVRPPSAANAQWAVCALLTFYLRVASTPGQPTVSLLEHSSPPWIILWHATATLGTPVTL